MAQAARCARMKREMAAANEALKPASNKARMRDQKKSALKKLKHATAFSSQAQAGISLKSSEKMGSKSQQRNLDPTASMKSKTFPSMSSHINQSADTPSLTASAGQSNQRSFRKLQSTTDEKYFHQGGHENGVTTATGPRNLGRIKGLSHVMLLHNHVAQKNPQPSGMENEENIEQEETTPDCIIQENDRRWLEECMQRVPPSTEGAKGSLNQQRKVRRSLSIPETPYKCSFRDRASRFSFEGLGEMGKCRAQRPQEKEFRGPMGCARPYAEHTRVGAAPLFYDKTDNLLLPGRLELEEVKTNYSVFGMLPKFKFPKLF